MTEGLVGREIDFSPRSGPRALENVPDSFLEAGERIPYAELVIFALLDDILAQSIEGLSVDNISRTAIQKACLDTVIQILQVHPAILIDFPRCIIRAHEKNILERRYEREIGLPTPKHSILCSGAGSVFPETWTLLKYDIEEGSQATVLQFLEMMQILSSRIYFEMARGLAAGTGTVLPQRIPAGFEGYGLSGCVVRPPIPRMVHLADPLLYHCEDQVQVSAGLREYMPAPLTDRYAFFPYSIEVEGLVPEDITGFCASADTHQSLARLYKQASVDELAVQRVDPLSLLDRADLDKPYDEKLRIEIQTLLSLMERARDGGEVFVSVGMGNSREELIHRLTLMHLLSSLLSRFEIPFIEIVTKKPSQGSYLVSENQSRTIERPFWGSALLRTFKGSWTTFCGNILTGGASIYLIKLKMQHEKLPSILQILDSAEAYGVIYTEVYKLARRTASQIVGRPMLTRHSHKKKTKRRKRKKRK